MKKSLLCLSLSALLLAGCSAPSDAGSLSLSGDISSESSSSQKESSPSEVKLPSEYVGTWYITSSNLSDLPLNGIFVILEDETLAIGQVLLELQGHYGTFEETYLFSYGTIRFIVSYDEVNDELDWAYQNGDTYGLGAASKTPISSSYDYEGSEFPMNQINEALGTKGSITPMACSTYRLKIFTSYYTKLKCADVEMSGTTLNDAIAYVSTLIEEGYSFPAYGGSLTESSFAVGYDKNKTYVIRIAFFENSEGDDETDLFVYNYDETLLPKESSEEA